MVYKLAYTNTAERDFEKLSRAITEAVMRSEKVRKLVEEIQKKENICPQSFMVLVLSMQSLSGAMGNMSAQEELDPEKKPPKRPRKKKAAENGQFIDGQKLSKNEIAFQEFINDRFDADEWFKRHGIVF